MVEVRLVRAVAGPAGAEVLALPVAPAAPADDPADAPGDGAADAPRGPGEGSPGVRLVAAAHQLPDAARSALSSFLERPEVKGSAGSLATLPLPGQHPGTVLLVGVGDATPGDLRAAGAAAARAAAEHASLVLVLPDGATAEAVGALAEGAMLATYRFTLAREAKEPALRTVELAVEEPAAAAAAVQRARVVAEATCLARDLVNTPGGTKSPEWLAARAVEAAEPHGVRATVRNPERLAEEGFGGLLAVGGGSSRGPRLVELAWEPPDAASARHVVLVGKGITFDTGGISIKPGQAMHLMKKDMGGGAAVLGAVVAAARLGLPVRVTVLVPAAENMPSGSAYRPGDVVTHHGGATSEVRNTDAEGRVVLADALAYAAAQLAPDLLVDLATLTGAASVALGKRTAALFSPDDALATALAAAATAAGEKLWRLPLHEDYTEHLDSDVADVANARAGRDAGAVSAALYLRHFAGDAADRWAHVDMSAPAWSDGARGELTKGATGWGVRTLVRWLEDLDADQPARHA